MNDKLYIACPSTGGEDCKVPLGLFFSAILWRTVIRTHRLKACVSFFIIPAGPESLCCLRDNGNQPMQSPPNEFDFKKTYDAVIIGSGAAGGMAAHVLTSHGMQVLLLEAGKKLDIERELKSLQRPYDHTRRGELPPDSHALTFNEYTFRKPGRPKKKRETA